MRAVSWQMSNLEHFEMRTVIIVVEVNVTVVK